MATAKKTPAKSASTAKKAPAKDAASSGFNKKLKPSPELAAIIGSEPMPRTEVTKKLWEYIKKHKLQDTADKRNINADTKLQKVFGKPQANMFEMAKLVSPHLS